MMIQFVNRFQRYSANLVINASPFKQPVHNKDGTDNSNEFSSYVQEKVLGNCAVALRSCNFQNSQCNNENAQSNR